MRAAAGRSCVSSRGTCVGHLRRPRKAQRVVAAAGGVRARTQCKYGASTACTPPCGDAPLVARRTALAAFAAGAQLLSLRNARADDGGAYARAYHSAQGARRLPADAPRRTAGSPAGLELRAAVAAAVAGRDALRALAAAPGDAACAAAAAAALPSLAEALPVVGAAAADFARPSSPFDLSIAAFAFLDRAGDGASLGCAALRGAEPVER